MKKIVLFCIAALLYFQSFTQVSVHEFMPMSVYGIYLGDTLLNTRPILKREGVKKITSYHDRSGVAIIITVHLNDQAAPEEMITCIKRKDGKPVPCNSDTIIYDGYGRKHEFRMRNPDGNIMMQSKVEYNESGKVIEITIAPIGQTRAPDTIITHRYHNMNNQLVQVENFGEKAIKGKAFLFYNDDGLIDSIRYDDPSKATEIFKRNKRGKNKEIELDDKYNMFKWMYNSAGQCISYKWISKKNPKPARSESYFYYNSNGTLSKVIEKSNGKNSCTSTYSYEK